METICINKRKSSLQAVLIKSDTFQKTAQSFYCQCPMTYIIFNITSQLGKRFGIPNRHKNGIDPLTRLHKLKYLNCYKNSRENKNG